MYRITANAAATLTGKRRRQRTDVSTTSPSPIETARRRSSPALAAESAELMAELSAALDELPRPSSARVVVLKDVYGLSHEAIADELGISVAAAKVRLHRAGASCETCSTTKERAHAV